MGLYDVNSTMSEYGLCYKFAGGLCDNFGPIVFENNLVVTPGVSGISESWGALVYALPSLSLEEYYRGKESRLCATCNATNGVRLGPMALAVWNGI